MNILRRLLLTLKSKRTLTHPKCLKTKVCQETAGFKGTVHEGVDVCEDGCVWYNPKTVTDDVVQL